MPIKPVEKFIHQYLLKNNYLNFYLLFLVVAIIFTSFQLHNVFPDPDAFYHMKMGQLIWQQGFVLDFPWQQFTVLKDYFIDHHLLYHVFLAPFVSLVNPFVGIKLAVILLGSAFIATFTLVLHKMKMRGAIITGLIVALTSPFTFRINLVKDNSLALIFLFIGIYLLAKKKFLWLFLLSFLFVWTYGGFLILLLTGIIFWLTEIVYNKFHRVETRLPAQTGLIASLQGVSAIITGTITGIIINPYFPKNLSFYWQQLVQIGIINYQSKIGVGGEWYPYGFIELLTGCSLITVLAIVALIFFIIFIKKQNALSWFGLVMYLFGLGLVLKSRRYIEYYVPFAALFIVVSYTATLAQLTREKIKHWLLVFWQQSWITKSIIFIVNVYFLLIIPAVIIKDYQTNYHDLKSGSSFDTLRSASQWLAHHSPEGSIVLHSDWDEFPELFYYNSHNYYIVGLDPTFMYKYNEELYWLWVNITIGTQKEDLPNIIKNKFQASYVLLTKDHTSMDNNIRKFSEFKLIYEDDEAKIYQVE